MLFSRVCVVLLLSCCSATLFAATPYGSNSADWSVSDNTPAGATVTALNEPLLGKSIAKTQGNDRANAYLLGGLTEATGWNNQTQSILTWSLRAASGVTMYVRINTTEGWRFLYYNRSPNTTPLKSSGRYIHHGLGHSFTDGEWHTWSRDLAADLNTAEPDNTLLSVDGIMIRGDIQIDGVTLSSDNKAPSSVIAASSTSIELGESITLDGQTSSDSDGTLSQYVWRNAIGDIVSNDPQWQATPSEAGLQQYSLEVTDNNGATAITTVTIDVTGEPAATSAPNNPTITSPADNVIVAVGTSIELVWQADPLATTYDLGVVDPNTNATSYDAGIDAAEICDATTCTLNVSDLTVGEAYQFRIRANNSVGSSQWSEQAFSVAEPSTIKPSVPVNLTGTIDGTVVSLSWDPSTDNDVVAGYNVYENNQYLTTVSTTQYTGTVIDGETYGYKVVAFDTDNNFSAASARLILPDNGPVDTTIPPSAPTGIAGEITGSGTEQTVTINWTASTDDQAVAGYNVYENDAYKTTVFDTSFVGTVQADTAYAYYVVAFDYDDNYSPRTSTLVLPDNIVISEDTEAPSTPGDLIGTWEVDGSTATISLSWTPSTDNVGVAGYNLYENNAYLTTVTDTEFTTTVDSDASYSYTVVAFDIARNFSAASERRTLPEGDNLPPVFAGLGDQVGEAGREINILIKPTDIDGDVPGLFIGNLPTGMQSVDNLDGSRTLRFWPLQPDVGSYDITVTAFDSEDSTLTTVKTFTLTIIMPDDPSTIRNAAPGIDYVGEHLVRVGDTVVMQVKATDANGTVPDLTIENLPTGATFDQHPEFPTVKVLRWTTTASDLGLNTFYFRAVDAEDTELVANSSVPINVAEASQFVRGGERLKTLADAKGIKIGYASLLNYFNRPDADLYQATAAEEFNLVTPENSMKWGYINPEPGVYRFAAADTLVDFAAANNMQLHGHTLVWYTSLPQWVQTAPLDERETIMNEFIDTITARYNTVDIWDVVNEAFEDDGSYRNSTWYQAMGKDYIEKAFRRARAGAPSAQLIYNEYDIAYGDAKTDATFTLMEELIAADAPIDGIGFQMHIGADFTDFDKIRSTFERFANLGLDIYITEMDVGKREGTTEADQANVFAEITQICLDQTACKALQVWGITDRYTWLSGTEPLLLDRDYQPKPAYTAIQDVLSAE